jgi:hypothetical protein
MICLPSFSFEENRRVAVERSVKIFYLMKGKTY